MAENAKIAALRAASPATPQGPSGPQALVYPWMQAQGRELVVPDRAPIDQQAWRDARNAKSKRPPPPPPATGPRIPIGPGGKSVVPVNPPPVGPEGGPEMGGYGDVYVPQEPAPREAFSEPVYFDPGQFSYVPEPAVASAQASEPATQESSAPIEWQPNFFLEGFTGAAPTPPAAPAPAPSPELAMYDPALLEMLQQQQQLQDPMAQMQMAYSDPYSRMDGRFFDV